MTGKQRTTTTKIHIQLQRNLTGWGGLHEVLEVERTPEVEDLLEQELATEVDPKDLQATPEGLQQQPPVTEGGQRQGENDKS